MRKVLTAHANSNLTVYGSKHAKMAEYSWDKPLIPVDYESPRTGLITVNVSIK